MLTIIILLLNYSYFCTDNWRINPSNRTGLTLSVGCSRRTYWEGPTFSIVKRRSSERN